MASLPEHIARKMKGQAARWAGLPVFPPGMEFSDEDAEAWGEILYMRGLVEGIEADYNVILRRISDAPTVADVSWAIYIDKSAKLWPVLDLEFSPSWDDALAVLDGVADELEAWRIHLAAQRNSVNWWLGEQRHSADAARAVA